MTLKFVLSDVGNVLIEIDLLGRQHALARQYGLDPDKVAAVLYEERMFHGLERGTVSWETYRETRLAHLRELGAVLAADAASHFDATWLSVLRGPIEPVSRIWRALRGKVAVVSVSNVDVHSYEHGVRRFPQVTGCFTHETHSFRFGRRKGDKDYFPALLLHLGAKPEECLFVDDLLEHVVTAKAHGIPICWLKDTSEGAIELLRIRLVEEGVKPEWLPSRLEPGLHC